MDKHHCLACDTIVEGLDLYILHKRQDCPALQLVRSTFNVSASTASVPNKEIPTDDGRDQTGISDTDGLQDDNSQEKGCKEAESGKAADTESLITSSGTHSLHADKNLPTADHRLPSTRSKTNRLTVHRSVGSSNVTKADGQEEDLNVHRREMRHMLYWGSTCVFCGKTVSKGPCLKGHIQAVHLGEKPHKCQHCSYSTAWATDLRMHVKRHLNIKPFKCPECDYTAVRMVAVKRHLQMHGEGEPRRLCDICGKSFAGNLQRHMTLHEGHKPFECPYDACTYAATFKQGLTNHIRSVHRAEKSIVCEECGFATTTVKLMKWHIRRKHSAEKPHKCDQCSYATSWQPHLIRHKRTHTGEKPYNCPHCSYRANNVENLRKHILKTKKHEGLKQYVCKWCPYNTNSQHDFSHHLRNTHPGEDLGVRPTFVLGINRGAAKMKSVRSQDKLGHLATASVVQLEHDENNSTGGQGTLPDILASQDKLQYLVEETKIISDNGEGGK
ncbi:hypothetical protein Bbelb_405990 [Branchiostoma belcheri]|nr:hypothetical protein Bbelb_405990 [Branchiostoma belcheri]